ncbi:hypothetical protein [Actinomadura sp. 9N407]|uniref:hypothetical protein n=1 Tax=Actinomadura sp. 9N407 TaxID=3375154 RepID=UPI0037904551
MALSRRTRIAIAVAGMAGAAAIGTGGAVAIADPGDGGRVELQIVSGHRDAPQPGTEAGWTAHDPGKDCPDRTTAPDRTATPEAAPAADGR